jgi:peptide/nickel transport system permease protein
MLKYLMQRVVISVVLIAILSFVCFVLIDLPPGDFLTVYINNMQVAGREVDAAEISRLVKLYDLDQSLPQQYVSWITGIVTRGDFGRSFSWNRQVKDILKERLPLSISISLMTLCFVWAVAVPIGFFSAKKQYSLADYVFNIVGFIGLAVPEFLIALLLVWLIFSYTGVAITGLFSKEFETAPWSLARVADMLKHVWLPMIVIGLNGTASLIRILRGNLLDELNKQYVVTARAKGLSEIRNLLKYPVRVAINPAISTIGWTLPHIVSGEIIVSIVLNLETMGPVLLGAVLSQDMYLAGSIVLILSTLTVIGTVISDILLAILDPRIRYGGMAK